MNNMVCKFCRSENSLMKKGYTRNERQIYVCKNCNKVFYGDFISKEQKAMLKADREKETNEKIFIILLHDIGYKPLDIARILEALFSTSISVKKLYNYIHSNKMLRERTLRLKDNYIKKYDEELNCVSEYCKQNFIYPIKRRRLKNPTPIIEE